MAPHWDWLAARTRPGDKLLNLFGYTGLASLVAVAAGAQVTHVDASKKAVAAARDNAALSGLADAPVRWLVDDALKFMRREVRRGSKYHGIIMDPPKYGRGPEGEVWALERDLPELVHLAAQLLADDARFVILTVYAIRMSALSIGRLLGEAIGSRPGTTDCGDMATREETRGLLLPTAIFARYEGSGPGSARS